MNGIGIVVVAVFIYIIIIYGCYYLPEGMTNYEKGIFMLMTLIALGIWGNMYVNTRTMENIQSSTKSNN